MEASVAYLLCFLKNFLLQSKDDYSNQAPFCLTFSDNPFWEEGMDNETLYDVICNSPYFPLPERISEEADHLISRLLEKNPSKRLGSYREKDILEHPWFGNVDMETLRAKKIKAPKIPDPIEF